MKKHFVLLMGLVLLLTTRVNGAAEKWAGWGDLQPGPNAVGFKLTTAYDQTRIFHSNAAFRGLSEQAETARPIRIYIWYRLKPPNRNPCACAIMSGWRPKTSA